MDRGAIATGKCLNDKSMQNIVLEKKGRPSGSPDGLKSNIFNKSIAFKEYLYTTFSVVSA